MENKTKHTPAPWYSENYCGIYTIQHQPKYGAYDVLNTDDVGEQVAKANATLIQHAPELLDALKDYCLRVDLGEMRSNKESYAKFKELIKKATGDE